MKFYILQEELGFNASRLSGEALEVNAGVSVDAYRSWFLKCLKRFGSIMPLGRRDLTEQNLTALLKKDNAIFVMMSVVSYAVDWRRIPHRLLELSLGRLMLPEYQFTARHLPSAEVQLVSTLFQAQCLRETFGTAVPRTEVFAPRIDTDFYVPADSSQRKRARKAFGVKEGQTHIVFAGRWTPTKGACQLIRMLSRWPLEHAVVTITADTALQQYRSAASGEQFFSIFMQQELLGAKRPWLRIYPETKDRRCLRELFWSGDVFVNPSVQPDENFGITPREAASCGLPCVTTNFCGLRPLAESMPWNGVDSYPTPAGLRFSLRELRGKLSSALSLRHRYLPAYYRDRLLEECSTDKAIKGLQNAIAYLGSRPAELPLAEPSVISSIKKQLLRKLDERMLKFLFKTDKEIPEPVLFYGDRPFEYSLPAVQSIYAAKSTPPKVGRNQCFGGFFRVGLWPGEQVLVEFGSPHARFRHFQKREWDALTGCAHMRGGEYVFIPKNKNQVTLLQDLVNLGYLVSESQETLGASR